MLLRILAGWTVGTKILKIRASVLYSVPGKRAGEADRIGEAAEQQGSAQRGHASFLSLEEASSLPAAAVAAEAAPLAECEVAAVGICTESLGAGQKLLPLPKKQPFYYGPKVQALAHQSPEGQGM